MNTEITITSEAATAALRILENYVSEKCLRPPDSDYARLLSVIEALGEADRIVIAESQDD